MSKLNLYVVAFILGKIEEIEGDKIRFSHSQFLEKVLAENEEEAIRLTIKNTIAELNEEDELELIQLLLEKKKSQFTCCLWDDLKATAKHKPDLVNGSTLVGGSEMAKMLGVSRQLIYYWQRNKKIPFHYQNGKIMFDEHEVKEAYKKISLKPPKGYPYFEKLMDEGMKITAIMKKMKICSETAYRCRDYYVKMKSMSMDSQENNKNAVQTP